MALEITEANAREAGAAASRLLRDQFLNEALDEMIEMHTQTAITGPTADDREDARRQVNAIMALRANLKMVFENWQSAATVLAQAKAHE